MERLTGWDNKNAYLLKCFESDGCPDMDTSKCDFCEYRTAIFKSLAAYEDTGLTPKEINHINTFVGAQSAKLFLENAQLKEQLKIADKCIYDAITYLQLNSPHFAYRVLTKRCREDIQEQDNNNGGNK